MAGRSIGYIQAGRFNDGKGDCEKYCSIALSGRGRPSNFQPAPRLTSRPQQHQRHCIKQRTLRQMGIALRRAELRVTRHVRVTALSETGFLRSVTGINDDLNGRSGSPGHGFGRGLEDEGCRLGGDQDVRTVPPHFRHG